MSKPELKIFQTGNFTLDNATETLTLTVPISAEETQNFENVPHPGSKLLDEPVVFSSVIGQYGSATAIEELNAAVGEDHKDLFWVLFELCATFPTVQQIALDLTRPDIPAVMLKVKEGVHKYAWWHRGTTHIFVAAEVLSLPVDNVEGNSIPFNPGELLYAFSVVAEHIRLGTTRFVIGNLVDRERVYISFFDHEIVDFRTNLDFPLMKERVISVQ
ncbi:hypothetical protein MOA67_gp292 [Klebsiella phage KpLz-2_45]|uniref:hypothetical protein n=1 Tax=Klebsiella phage KpLz-2_45 TaxID=2698923 RepID=UPI001F1419F6|nr:hypothetical protein MOA67_gp292 [Klebsiella phage KpLz-2_45]UKS72131.1 hypothetical protein KpLz245_2650 [Klebsiella phage KpLz-2_45]